MRYVKIPEPITIVDPVTMKSAPGAQTMTFYEFISYCVIQDIGGSRKMWNKANELGALIKEATDVLVLSDEDWTILSRACDAPKPNLKGNETRQLVAFLNAVCEATTSDPRQDDSASTLATVTRIGEGAAPASILSEPEPPAAS